MRPFGIGAQFARSGFSLTEAKQVAITTFVNPKNVLEFLNGWLYAREAEQLTCASYSVH